MRTLTAALLAALASAIPSAPADAPPVAPVSLNPATAAATDWRADPVCRMVFHAVLEGLYEDGVPDAVAVAIAPRPKAGADPVKGSFVVQCPLCLPVFEAFAAYRDRPAFTGDSAGRGTFGKLFDPATAKALTAEDAKTRLKALAPLVRTWVERRLTAMRLTPDEKADWAKKLGDRSQEGKRSLMTLIKTDPNYNEWSPYWGCAACNGTTDACRAVKVAASEE